MRKKRKTIEVETLIRYANSLLAITECPYPEYLTAEYKHGVCDMIEKVLSSSGNYRGYIFLHPDKLDMDKGTNYLNPYEFTRKYLIDNQIKNK